VARARVRRPILSDGLSGDLDGILLKALEKDPRPRYHSVDQFSMELDRHLKGEPVLVGKAGRFADAIRMASKYRWYVGD
jgi:hypothetical protein